MNFQLRTVFLLLLSVAIFTACSDSNSVDSELEVPPLYEFTRDGQSTVSFTGQTTRINMAEEMVSYMKNFDELNKTRLLEMYRNETADGGDADPFSSDELNAAAKNIKSKAAASRDFFFSNTTRSTQIKNQFEGWLEAQVDEVLPARNQQAQPGTAGQLPRGSGAEYVNAKGLDYYDMTGKGLIGALMADQALNHYLGQAVLDEGQNRENNDNGVPEEDNNYTAMEHNWDEAYGYVYGTTSNAANPNPTLEEDASFLGEYLAEVDGMAAFEGTAETVFNAFKRGRAAIVAGRYEIRDEQASIIREELSKVIGVRGVYYLQQAKFLLAQDNPEYGAVFHALSEAYGFIYSLQFTRVPNTDSPYFTGEQVDEMLNRLTSDGPDGFWDVTPETLDAISSQIAGGCGFTVEEAAG